MLKICESVFNTLLFSPPCDRECGGILGEMLGVICDIQIDFGNDANAVSYTPNTEKLNATIRTWQENGIAFCGFFHTHPTGDLSLSAQDRQYMFTVLQAITERKKSLLFPVVSPQKSIVCYKAFLQNGRLQIQQEKLIITRK